MVRAVGLVVALVTLHWGTAEAVAAPRAQPLPYKEIITGGAAADAELPLVIALHGRGDTPEGFAPLFEGWDARARVIIPRPPHPWGGGYAWTPLDHLARGNGAAIAADLVGLADRVVATADAVRRARRTRGTGVVMGFSQGGMMAWTIAVRHPRAFVIAFPVAGFLVPEVLGDKMIGSAGQIAVIAFHGADDRLVPLADDRRGVRLLEQRGGVADLRVYDGVGHEIPPKMRTDLLRSMVPLLAQ